MTESLDYSGFIWDLLENIFIKDFDKLDSCGTGGIQKESVRGLGVEDLNQELIFLSMNGKPYNFKEMPLGVDVSVVVPQVLENVNMS